MSEDVEFCHCTNEELEAGRICGSPNCPNRLLAPAEVREADARNFPHDEPCPRCGRRQWGLGPDVADPANPSDDEQETCGACGYRPWKCPSCGWVSWECMCDYPCEACFAHDGVSLYQRGLDDGEARARRDEGPLPTTPVVTGPGIYQSAFRLGYGKVRRERYLAREGMQ